jgi:5-methylcytosine-specific restriction endonuclease McrA
MYMPVCRGCNKQFPNIVKIDGKDRNLCKRKFCLDCSPFGSHNTRPSLDYDENDIKARRRKQLVDNTMRRRKKVQAMAIEYKGGKCQICGYDRCTRALEFHHLNPDEKEFSISRDGSTRSWERTKIELDKCILLCANCHREVEDGMTEIPK